MERMLNSKGTAGKTSQNSYSSTTTFTGSVGLMYPSDYGYAVLASDCARTITPEKYTEPAACHDNNWLFQGSNIRQWLISPGVSFNNYAFIVHANGYATHMYIVTVSVSYSPVMALKSDVIVRGSGTQSDPYVMN